MSKQSTVGKLSEAAVRQSKAKEKPYKLADGGGLYLLVNPKGAKYWRLKYRLHGKEKILALGVYPGVSMAEARREAVQAKEGLRQAVDPLIKRKQDAQLKADNTFFKIAEEWHTKEKGGWTNDHAERVWITLVQDVFPAIGDLPINDIKTIDCLNVIRVVEARGALDVAGRVKQRIGRVFRYAIQTARCDYNPADQLQGVIKTRKVTHMAALPEDALPSFFARLEQYEGHVVTRLALKFLVHTFVRPGELRGARWSEINFDKQEWRIPAERMKMSEEHIVPLTYQTLAILEEIKTYTGNYNLIFPGMRDCRKPMSENTLTFAIKKRLGFDATAHGFRSTASTILNEKGFRSEVIERQLAHVERNKIRAAYNRSQYLLERRDMMKWWGDYLENLTTDKKVVSIRVIK